MMLRTLKLRVRWGAALVLLSVLLFAAELGVPGPSLWAEASGPLAGSILALADEPDPAVQQPDPNDAPADTPQGPPAVPTPTVPAPTSSVSSVQSEPSATPVLATGSAEPSAPASPTAPLGESLPLAGPPAMRFGPPPWSGGGFLPPPVGDLVNPFAGLPPVPPLLPPAVPPALIVIRAPAPPPAPVPAAPVVALPTATPTPTVGPATGTPTRPASIATSTPTAVSSALSVVPCRDLRTLRELASRVRTVTNARTGHTLEYLVVGDGARSSQLLVFFNGTSQIIPDWPIQMITNSTASPLITTTDIYSPAQDSARSLCQDYRLVFFDYPGVGLSPFAAGVTYDQIANDVDAMLADIGQRYRIPTNSVNVVGWSLGTEAGLKYSFLSPVANPGRTIQDVILIATKPGGGQSAQTNGNGAQCVDYPFTVLENPNISTILRDKLEANNYQLLFPYQGQPPNEGPSSGCTVDINTTTDTVVLNVTPTPCGLRTQCLRTAAEFAANRLTHPWSLTRGISQRVLVNQRQLANDWAYAYCPTAGPSFTSVGCTSLPSQPPELSATNGGVCQTTTPPGLPNQPTATQCVPLQIQGSLTVINGREDLYIQHTYGAALVAAYQRQYGAQKARLVTYSGADGAGHGILLQHPKFVQESIFTALQTTGPDPRMR